MTRGFWKDKERYLDSYWRRIPGTWVHGDFAAIDADGLWYILGRSDDTIKIAGKRLGVSSRKRLHWGRKILHFRIALHDSLRLPKRRLLAVFLLSSTHWLLRFSVLDLTLRGLGVDIQWAWTFLIQMVSLSAGQLSLIPGGAGGTELTSAALLAPMIGKSTAAAAIVVWRAVTFYFSLVAGGPVFAVLAGRPLLKKLISSREASS